MDQRLLPGVPEGLEATSGYMSTALQALGLVTREVSRTHDKI